MGWFGEDTKKCQVGVCMSCGKPMIGKIGVDTGELKSKPSVTLKDGTFICEECVKAKDLLTSEVEDKTKEELLKFYKEKNFISPDEFTPMKRVHFAVSSSISPRKNLVYMEIDEERELINIPVFEKGFFSDDLFDWVIPWSKILDFKVMDNGTQTMEGNSLLGAAVGGVLFGGAGAIVGSSLGSHSISGKCTSLMLKIVIDDIKINSRHIDFIGGESEIKKAERNSYDFGFASAKLEECISLLTIILKRKQEKQMASIQNQQVSPPTQDDTITKIKKLAELKDAGIITVDEFEQKKKELLDSL